MQLTWIPERRRFVGTQTEARTEKAAFEVRDVPTVKAELIDYLNAREAEHEEELAALRAEIETLREEAGDAAETDTTIQPVQSAPTRPAQEQTSGTDIIEQILELDAGRLAPVLSAAIGRLGEVAGTKGWGVFGKSVYAWSPGARSVEQGLGMLMLAAFDNMGRRNAPKEVRPAPITPMETGGEDEE